MITLCIMSIIVFIIRMYESMRLEHISISKVASIRFVKKKIHEHLTAFKNAQIQ